MEPLIIASARKRGVADDDILHAFNHPIRYEDFDDSFVLLIGSTRSAQLIEVGFIDTDHGGHHAMTARRVLEVMPMPRSLQEILEHADELERRFAEHDPADVRDAAPLHAIRDAVTQRAATERRIAEAVTVAREAGVSWSAIGGMLGTSGEAARKRYSRRPAETT